MVSTEFSEEDIFLHTLKEYLESNDEHGILKHLNPAKVVFNYSSSFSNKLWNQRSVYIEIKVPVRSKKPLEEETIFYRLQRYCGDIYEDTDEYGYKGLQIGVLAGIPVTAGSTEQKDIMHHSKLQVYENLRSKVLQLNNLDPLEQTYLLEACSCAVGGQRLAAATMLGCAAEQLLLLISRSYLKFLENHGSLAEAKKFKENVLEAKKAHARLEGFQKTVANKEKLFESLGLENSNLHFTFLDFIRQVRNESGHPTGIVIREEDLNTIFGNYQLILDRIHPLILKLPRVTPV